MGPGGEHATEHSLLSACNNWLESDENEEDPRPLSFRLDMGVDWTLHKTAIRSWRCEEWGSGLLKEVFSEMKFTDMVIVAGGDEIGCHRTILASASKVSNACYPTT